jgi:hypothetical protein
MRENVAEARTAGREIPVVRTKSVGGSITFRG